MPLHIEISGDCSPREWEALALLTAVMRGEDADILQVIRHSHPGKAPTGTPEQAPPASNISNTAPAPTAAPSTATAAQPSLSETLLAEEASRVSAVPPAPPIPGAPTDLDVDGLPWDVRIHSGAQTKTQDGRWKKKKGIEKAFVATIEAELKRVMGAPAAAPSAPAAPPPPAEADPAAAFPAQTATPAAPPPPAADPAPVAPAAAGAEEFSSLMRDIVARQTAGSLSTELPAQIAQQLGLTGIADLMKRPDLIPAFRASLPA